MIMSDIYIWSYISYIYLIYDHIYIWYMSLCDTNAPYIRHDHISHCVIRMLHIGCEIYPYMIMSDIWSIRITQWDVSTWVIGCEIYPYMIMSDIWSIRITQPMTHVDTSHRHVWHMKIRHGSYHTAKCTCSSSHRTCAQRCWSRLLKVIGLFCKRDL